MEVGGVEGCGLEVGGVSNASNRTYTGMLDELL